MATACSRPNGRTSPADDAELIGEARRSRRELARPRDVALAPCLYPHQWSWDAACIAMGYARWNQERAETELRSLFAGQWRERAAAAHRLHGRTRGTSPAPSSGRPSGRRTPRAAPKTSGIVQPPIHATAAWQVYRLASDRARATAFLEELAAEARRLARVPVPRARTERRRSRRDLASRGSRAWTTRRSGTRRSTRIVARRRSRSRTTERVDVERRRRLRAADRRRVRPLRLPRRALPRARLRPGAHPGRDAVRAPARALQLAPRPVEPGPGRDRALLGADPEPFESWAESDRRRASTRRSGTTSTRSTSTTT